MTISATTQGLRPGVCTSTSRPSSPFTGQLIFETDTNRLAVWNGTSWVVLADADTPSGLDLVKSVSFSASSQVDVTDCFSSTYDNYRVQIEWLQNTSNGELNFRMRDSGGTISTNYGFNSSGTYYSSGTVTFSTFNSSVNETQTSGYLMGVAASSRASGSWDVFGPNLSRETNWIGQVSTSNATATLTRVNVISSNRHTSATSCTGFSLIPTAGTVTGNVRVYGYRNS